MKTIKQFFLGLVMVLSVGVWGQQKPKVCDIESIKRDLIKEAFVNSDMKNAFLLIAEENSDVDLKNPSILNNNFTSSLIFNISNSENNNEFFNVIYRKNKNGKALVYFDNKNEKFINVNKPNNEFRWPPKWWPFNQDGEGVGCGSWADWRPINQYCDYYFACFFKGQTATYVSERKECISNSGIFRERTYKDKCGCK